jgi:hypothetical protein
LRKDDGFRDAQVSYWIQLLPANHRITRWNLYDYLRSKYQVAKARKVSTG